MSCSMSCASGRGTRACQSTVGPLEGASASEAVAVIHIRSVRQCDLSRPGVPGAPGAASVPRRMPDASSRARTNRGGRPRAVHDPGGSWSTWRSRPPTAPSASRHCGIGRSGRPRRVRWRRTPRCGGCLASFYEPELAAIAARGGGPGEIVWAQRARSRRRLHPAAGAAHLQPAEPEDRDPVPRLPPRAAAVPGRSDTDNGAEFGASSTGTPSTPASATATSSRAPRGQRQGV